jgi:peptide/nickel transport system substrate-binding protein
MRNSVASIGLHAPRRRRAVVATMIVVAVAALATAVTSLGATRASHASGTLVVDNSFVIHTADPQREFDPTSSIIDHAMYDTLVTFKGSGTTPVPWLATSWKASNAAKLFVFHLRKGVVFSDGTPLMAADVVFSFRRLINLKASGSFLLANVVVSAPNTSTVVLRSKVSNPALTRILANPALGIVNSKVVKANGGTDAAGADKKDKAERFLDGTSAGSGPYVLKQYSTSQQIVLDTNPRFWGPKPKFQTVVIRNMTAPTQLLNVQRGSDEIALDLSSQQASSLKSNTNVQVKIDASPNLFNIDMNMSPSVSSVTSNVHIRRAVRYALDYKAFAALGGPGSIQAAGMVPSVFLGALPARFAAKRNLAKAKAEVAASGISNPTIKLTYPAGLTINGIDFGVLAQKTKANLADAGITVNLQGLPVNAMLQQYAAAKDEMTQSYWGPDYPDPNDYQVFLPGGTAAVRVNWKKGADRPLEALGTRALQTVNDNSRAALYRRIQMKLNADSPFIPLFQPSQAIVASKNLTNAVLNFTWLIDLRSVGSH